jgi:tetratricopeptide (TPR) repeat protein
MLRRLLLLLCLLPAWPLQAQEAQPDYAGLVRDAVLAQQAGDYAQAIAMFQAAHQLSPNARTLRGLGVAEFLAGDPVAAIGHLEAALVHPEKPLDPELRTAVEELLQRARAMVASYRLETSPEGVTAQLDGAAPVPAQGLSLVLAPGEHTLVLAVEGYQSQRLALAATAGTREVLRVALAPIPAEPVVLPPVVQRAPEPPAQPAPLPTPAEPPRAQRVRIAKWATLALGGAALAGTFGTMLAGGLRANAIEDTCTDAACTDADVRRQTRKANIAGLERAFFVTSSVAAAALGSALGLWVVELRARPHVESHKLNGATLVLRTHF